MSRAAVVAPLALLALAGGAGTSSAAPTREPELTIPADMTVEAEAATGTGVSFTASAVGRENQSLPVTCSPASGSRFALGQTTVTCTAQDRPDEVTTKSFRITVVDRTPHAPARRPGEVERPHAEPAGHGREKELPAADNQRDRIAAPLDHAGTRVLADDTADSPGVTPLHRAERAVPLPDLPLRGPKPEP